MAGPIGFLGFCVLVFALVLVILSTALNDWHMKVQSSYGLWNSCSGDKCSSMKGENVPADLDAVRGMVVLSLILVSCGVAGGFLKLFVKIERKEINIGIMGVLLVSGLFLMTGFSIYTDKIYKPVSDQPGFMLGPGLICCILACLACWISGALFFIEEYAGQEETPGGDNTNPPVRARQ